MSKIINISDKFSSVKPKIILGEKEYEVNNSIETVLKFEELVAGVNSAENLIKAIEVSLGEGAINALDIKSMSLTNFKVLTIAILAAMQDIDFDEAEKRFQSV